MPRRRANMEFITKTFNDVLNAEYTHLDEETASFAYKVYGSSLHIYFEWSNGITDWKNNFDFPAKPYREMQDKWYCHRGFLKVWKAIEPHLKEQIMNPGIKWICIAGYSHGGAIAQLCYEYCKFNRPDCYLLGYGYGAPRVVWGFLNHRVKERFEGFIVVRNKRDIVTHLPPVLFGYRNIGTLFTIGKGSNYGLIEAHKPENYIKELEKFEALWEMI